MIIILDFGSQVAELIARRVRESHIYSEVLPHTTPFDVVEKKVPRGLSFLVDLLLYLKKGLQLVILSFLVEKYLFLVFVMVCS